MEDQWQRSADHLPRMILRLLQSLPDNRSKGTDMKTFLEYGEISAETVWTKSTRSGAAGHCVQAAKVAGGVALGHSKDNERGAFLYTHAEMDAFLQGVKDGDFDHLLSE